MSEPTATPISAWRLWLARVWEVFIVLACLAFFFHGVLGAFFEPFIKVIP